MSTAPYRQSSRTAYTRRKSGEPKKSGYTRFQYIACETTKARPTAGADGRQSSRGRRAIATTASAAYGPAETKAAAIGSEKIQATANASSQSGV